MTDRFHWHPNARLYDSAGEEASRGNADVDAHMPVIFPDSLQALASAMGHTAFRIGASDQPPPELQDLPVFETLTSGSTGQPRRIRRTQASWTASFAINARLGICPGARIATLGSLIHSLSLYGAVEGLHLGAEVHLLADLRPDRQRQALALRRITHLYATPAQLRLILGPGTLPDLRLILVGGSKLDAALRAGLRRVAPIAQIREFYGAAETSFITLSDDATPEDSVGRPYPGVHLRLDPEGEVWVRSPYLFMGYGTDAALASSAGRATAARWRDDWLSVGEIGELRGGFLYVKGRSGRMVTVADQNVFPEEIEAILEAMPGVNRAAVLPVPDPMRGHSLVAVLQGDARQEVALLTALRARLGPTRAPKAVIWRDSWPVLASGKTDLKALEATLSWRA